MSTPDIVRSMARAVSNYTTSDPTFSASSALHHHVLLAVPPAPFATLQEKEVLRRKERDRANLAERQIEQLNESLAAKDMQISGLMEKVTDSEAQLQQEQKDHEQTRQALQEAQAALRQREAEIQALQSQVDGQRQSATTAQQKLAALEKLAADFEAFAGEADADEEDIEAWRDALEARRAKALTILEAAERSALAVLSRLDHQGAEAQAVKSLAQQVLHRTSRSLRAS